MLIGTKVPHERSAHRHGHEADWLQRRIHGVSYWRGAHDLSILALLERVIVVPVLGVHVRGHIGSICEDVLDEGVLLIIYQQSLVDFTELSINYVFPKVMLPFLVI